MRSLLALVSLVISFSPTIFAQQSDTADLQTVQQRDLLGDAKALGEFGELSLRLDAAINKNDAVVLAAFFTEDAVLVAPDGMFSGRRDIQKRYQDTFPRSPIIDFNSRRESHHLRDRSRDEIGMGIGMPGFGFDLDL